jgi:membrane-anchored protein YejM (alkaline phosphatase superfamily)
MFLRPFGPTLSASLKNARIRKDGVAVWQERTIAVPRSRRNAPQCSTTISMTSASSRSRKARAGARSTRCLVSYRTKQRVPFALCDSSARFFAAHLDHGIARRPQYRRHHDRRSGGHGLHGPQAAGSFDDLVGGVVDTLKSTGKPNNTVIIYTSDNGFSYGDDRMLGKTSPYESSINVPLVVKGPWYPSQ